MNLLKMHKDILRLLEANQNTNVAFAHGLSNHLSMATIALYELGASIDVITRFNDNYRTKLEPLPTKEISLKINDNNLSIYLGQENLFINYKDYYLDELQRYGIESSLQKHLPILIPSVLASAFHAIIRLSYAVHLNNKIQINDLEIGNEMLVNEIAISLAYWASRYIVLPSQDKSINLSNHIQEFLKTQHNRIPLKNNLLYRDLIEISTLEIYKKYSGQPIPSQVSMQLLESFALNIYCKTKDFTALHMVTLMHAIHVLTPYTKTIDIDRLISTLWNNLLAAAIRSTRAVFKYDSDLNLIKDINQLKSKVILSNNDHDIKLFYSLTYMYKVRNNDLYFTALNVFSTGL